jgi:hypothetical protein
MNILTREVTLIDRFRAAYYAFCNRYTPDVESIMQMLDDKHDREDEELEALGGKRNEAIAKLAPYDIAIVDSVHGCTENWRELFDQAMLAIEQLSVDDQITIIKYLFAGNRYIVTEHRFRQWMSNHAEALLNSIPE